MTLFHLLDLAHVPIMQQLQLEERLLRHDERNWCLFNFGSTDAIVMGISAKQDEVIDPSRLSLRPVPVIRRFSGGGTVYIDPYTCFVTFLVQGNALSIAPNPRTILQWTHSFYKEVFAPIPLEIRGNDYAVAERKVGGNAQYLRRNRWLHHTSFVWDFSPEKMDLLRFPPKVPSYRGLRSHTEFLQPLKEWFPTPQAFLSACKAHFLSLFPAKEISWEEISPLLIR